MDERRTVKVSKYLSKHLRHQPEHIGIALDENGWVDVETLLSAAARHGFAITRAELDHVVATNDKRRFTVDGDRIRANQGHTVTVDLDLPPAEPPAYLYHGTVARMLDAIRAEGLRPMARHHVHLSLTVRRPPGSAPAAAAPWSSRWTRAPCTGPAMSCGSAPTESGWPTPYQRSSCACASEPGRAGRRVTRHE